MFVPLDNFVIKILTYCSQIDAIIIFRKLINNFIYALTVSSKENRVSGRVFIFIFGAYIYSILHFNCIGQSSVCFVIYSYENSADIKM